MKSSLPSLPMPIRTSRLSIRPLMPSDTARINEAIIESFDELTKWIPWANHKPTLAQTKTMVQELCNKLIAQEAIPMVILNKEESELLGYIGFNEIDWRVPKVNIGYWVRSSCVGKGIATEASNALTRYAFEQLKVARVEINCDEKNESSRRVIEKLKYTQEGILKHNRFYPKNTPPNNTVIYARYDTSGLPLLDVSW